MKTLIFYLTVALWAGVMNAQEVIQLNETRVGFNPLDANVTSNGTSFSFSVKEAYAGQFEQDPLLFMMEHFDVNNFISQIADKQHDYFQVTFKSRKGVFIADFDKKGNLLGSSQRFESVVLPQELRKQLAEKYKGWSVLKTVHKARGNGGENTVDFYQLKIANGKKKKNLKINAASIAATEVAFN